MTADLTPQERVAALRQKFNEASAKVDDCQARLATVRETLKDAAERLAEVQAIQQEWITAHYQLDELDLELASLEQELGLR